MASKKAKAKHKPRRKPRPIYETHPMINRDIRISQLITQLAMAHTKYGDLKVRCIYQESVGDSDDYRSSATFSPCLVVINEYDLERNPINSGSTPYLFLQTDVVEADLEGWDFEVPRNSDNIRATEILGEGRVDELIKSGRLYNWLQKKEGK